VTRATVRVLFVAMLALLATQSATVPIRGAVPHESVRKSDVVQEQQSPSDSSHVITRRQPSEPGYASLLLTEPDTVLLFQLPPPVVSLAS